MRYLCTEWKLSAAVPGQCFGRTGTSIRRDVYKRQEPALCKAVNQKPERDTQNIKAQRQQGFFGSREILMKNVQPDDIAGVFGQIVKGGPDGIEDQGDGGFYENRNCTEQEHSQR